MKKHLPATEKTLRAFRSWLSVLDTADWMRGEMKMWLDSFDLTVRDFRVLELLRRGGTVYSSALTAQFRCTRQNLKSALDYLCSNGWVRREVSWLAPKDVDIRRMSKKKRARPRRGLQITLLRLTPEGEKLVAHVFPKQAKLVKAQMRALEGREQETLMRLCQKLREGDVLKFMREMRYEDVDEGEFGGLKFRD